MLPSITVFINSVATAFASSRRFLSLYCHGLLRNHQWLHRTSVHASINASSQSLVLFFRPIEFLLGC